MRRILREPLVHFLLVGAAIYALYAALSPSTKTDDETVVRVTAGQVAALLDGFQKSWDRAPNPDELAGLIDQHVRETILYREALAMGLDREDVIVRRRLAQKVEFLSQDLLAPETPDDAALRAWFAERRGRYREPARVTFTHLFFDRDRRGERALADADAILAALGVREPSSELLGEFGDPFLLQAYFSDRSEEEIGRLFGAEFAASLLGLDSGRWHGPVLSGYGVHLAWIHTRTPARERPFEEVRARVAVDWTQERQRELNDEFHAELRDRYTVIIEEVAPVEAVAGVEDAP